jgi:hypothetical protein
LESIGAEPATDLRVHPAQVNGGAGVVITSEDRPITTLVLDVADGVVQTIHLVANPEKLTGVHGIEAP